MSVLSTSPINIRTFDMEIASALGSFEAAVILQQLHYWTQKEGVGVIVDDAKYIYNTFKNWVNQQFTFLTEWKFRKSMSILRSLEIVKVIRYKAPQWNQTNYYNLNYTKLREWAEAESIEISEMWSTSPQGDNNQTHEMKNPSTSLNESKITVQRETTKQSGDCEASRRHRFDNESSPIAAAGSKRALEGEENQYWSNPHSVEITNLDSQNKAKSEQNKSNVGKETNSVEVDYIVNKEWKKLISVLDGVGIPINKTVTSLLKLYPKEQVESAIALVKARKRDSHIPNLSGYFVSALKGEWGSKTLAESEGDRDIDSAAVFRYWYDLARELGYCSGQEVREGEQWVCISGSWEKWKDATKRGYSVDYLKKIIKRNQGR